MPVSITKCLSAEVSSFHFLILFFSLKREKYVRQQFSTGWEE